ncbi:conserved hypothetical protein [Actinomyces sp. oral taxon 180 str. F0310]|nr:conserved hypothetical protein [Actinomyces sp. oral taxon 180 str. F0310]
MLRHECPRLAPIQGRGPASPAPAVPPRLPLPKARPLRWGCVGPARPVLLKGGEAVVGRRSPRSSGCSPVIPLTRAGS